MTAVFIRQDQKCLRTRVHFCGQEHCRSDNLCLLLKIERRSSLQSPSTISHAPATWRSAQRRLRPGKYIFPSLASGAVCSQKNQTTPTLNCESHLPSNRRHYSSPSFIITATVQLHIMPPRATSSSSDALSLAPSAFVSESSSFMFTLTCKYWFVDVDSQLIGI